MPKYSLGIDYGTLSGRAVLVDVSDGTEVASSVFEYVNGVIDSRLPHTNEKLPPDWALQDPADYLQVLATTVPTVINKSKVSPDDVIGIGVDFTSCTMMPLDEKGLPLCFDPQWRKNPHSWAKLWKHHAAQPQAHRINELARKRNEPWLPRYGGKISSEWFFPKTLQILDESPEVYEAAHKLIEAGDWIVMRMTGNERRSACQAGFKAMWSKHDGYPSREFFAALDLRMENVVDEKLSRDIYPVGSKAGELTPEMARLMGLNPGTAVAVSIIDAHAAFPATTVTTPGKMVMILGTSSCQLALSEQPKNVEGISGYVEDGVIPGYFAYEAGQAAVGDLLAWFVKNGVPESYTAEAEKRGISVYALLTEMAAELIPGQSGLVALDWWNGNRSVLVDSDLSGAMVGMTLTTKPEEIFRTLIEATAFGTNIIIDAFESCKIDINELYACGGLAEKNPLLMQIYADVTGREIKVAESSQTSAHGAAMFGAVAAGASAGGYDTISEAAQTMAKVKDKVYMPDRVRHEVYQKLFSCYEELHDYFGRGGSDVMKRLRAMR